jgi:hypothetical protein
LHFDDPCVVRLERVPYDPDDLPQSLQRYLSMAHECVNPSCKGVYFDHRSDVPLIFLVFSFILAIILAFYRVEHVKFSDFCGKYKVPLLQYLCSPR